MRYYLYRPKCTGLLLACLLAAVLLYDAPVGAQSCGVASLFDFCVLIGQELPKEQQEAILEAYPAEGASMLDIKQAAESLRIALVGAKATIEELGKVAGPKILHLRDPAHFVVMPRASPEWVQLLDSGRVVVASRGEIERRYTGHALILEQEPNPGGARLQLAEFHYSFGIAGIGQEVEHVFTVTNVGNEDLTIGLQAKGCGAPSASIGKETLAPGESTDVTIKFTVAYSGNVTKSAKLLTNDLTQPVAFVTVHGKVPHDLRVWPDRLYFSGGKAQPLSRTITVSGPAEMDLKEISCEKGLFDIEVGEPKISEDEKKTWQLTLAFKPEVFVGEFEDQLSIRTTHPERPLITIPIKGRIRGDLEVRPPFAFFGFVEPGEKAEQAITIRSRSGADFAVKSAVADKDVVKLGTPQQRDGTWVIPVSVDTSQPGAIEATVTVTTDIPGEETLKIPVYAHVVAKEGQ